MNRFIDGDELKRKLSVVYIEFCRTLTASDVDIAAKAFAMVFHEIDLAPIIVGCIPADDDEEEEDG